MSASHEGTTQAAAGAVGDKTVVSINQGISSQGIAALGNMIDNFEEAFDCDGDGTVGNSTDVIITGATLNDAGNSSMVISIPANSINGQE